MTPMKRRVLHVTDDNERILEDLISPSPFRLTRFSSGQVRPSDEIPISHALPSSSVLSHSKSKKGGKSSLSTSCGSSSSVLVLNSTSPSCAGSSSGSVAGHVSSNRRSSTSLGKSLLVAYDGFILLDGDHRYSVPSSREQAFELYVELRKCLQFLLPFVKTSSLGISSGPLRAGDEGNTENNGEHDVNFPCEEELRDKEIEALGVIFQKKKLRKEAKAAKHFSYSELREKLKALKLPFSGTKGILQSRLKNYYRNLLKEMDAHSSQPSCVSSTPTAAPCTPKRHSWEARPEKEMPSAIGEEMEQEEEEEKDDLGDVVQAVLSPPVSLTPWTETVSLPCVAGSLPPTTVSKPPASVGRLCALFEDEPACPTSQESLIEKEGRRTSSSDLDTGEGSFRPSFVPFRSSLEEKDGENVEDVYSSDAPRISPPLFSSTSMDVGEGGSSSPRCSSSSLVEFSNRSSHVSHRGSREEDDDNDNVEEDGHGWGGTADEKYSFMEGGVMVSPSTVQSAHPSEERFSSPSASTPMTPLCYHPLSLNEETHSVQPLFSPHLEEATEGVRFSHKAQGVSLGVPKESSSRTSEEEEEEEEEVCPTGLWGSIKHAGNKLLKSVAPLTPTRHGKGQKRRRSSME